MKDIFGYEGIYKISENGEIWSVQKKLFRASAMNNSGYYKLPLYKNGVAKNGYIHRLMAQTYLPNVENKEQVNHIDGDKTNNHISNLEWSTRSENMVHASKKGLLRKEATPIARVSKDGIILEVFGGWRSIKDGGYEQGNVARCLKNPTATHKGFRWKYIS